MSRFTVAIVSLYLLLQVVSGAVYVTSERQCHAGTIFREVAKCDQAWGFNLAVFQQNLPGYVIELGRLIDYCRRPEKDIYRCIRTAYGSCDPDWRVDILRRGKQDGGLGRRAFKYLCSNNAAIDQHRDCIQDSIWEISACFRIAAEDFIGLIEENRGSRGRGRKWSRKSSNIRRMGENIEHCVQEHLRQACDGQVANVLGNFLHGILVYPYLDRNSSSSALD